MRTKENTQDLDKIRLLVEKHLKDIYIATREDIKVLPCIDERSTSFLAREFKVDKHRMYRVLCGSHGVLTYRKSGGNLYWAWRPREYWRRCKR